MYVAAARGHLAVVQYLCDRGTDVDTSLRRSGRTPLHIACELGHTAIVKCLLPRVQLLHATTIAGKLTAYDLAANEDIKQALRDEEAVRDDRHGFRRPPPPSPSTPPDYHTTATEQQQGDGARLPS